MNTQKIIELISMILEKQGKSCNSLTAESALRDIQFRSLDFSELCLRVEQELGRELNFTAENLRNMQKVSDICNFISGASK